MSEKIVLERRKTKKGWSGVIRDPGGTALFTTAMRGPGTFYDKSEVGDRFNNLIAAIKESNFETRDA